MALIQSFGKDNLVDIEPEPAFWNMTFSVR